MHERDEELGEGVVVARGQVGLQQFDARLQLGLQLLLHLVLLHVIAEPLHQHVRLLRLLRVVVHLSRQDHESPQLVAVLVLEAEVLGTSGNSAHWDEGLVR